MASPSPTLAPSGSKGFREMVYVIRADKRFLKPGTNQRRTQALLVKLRGPTDLDLDSVRIRTPTKDYDTLEAYLEDYAVSPFKDWCGAWMFIEVLVKTLDLYNSNWISGMAFKDGTAPSDPPTYMRAPPPVPSYASVAPHLATFPVRHTTRKAPYCNQNAVPGRIDGCFRCRRHFGDDRSWHRLVGVGTPRLGLLVSVWCKNHSYIPCLR